MSDAQNDDRSGDRCLIVCCIVTSWIKKPRVRSTGDNNDNECDCDGTGLTDT